MKNFIKLFKKKKKKILELDISIAQRLNAGDADSIPDGVIQKTYIYKVGSSNLPLLGAHCWKYSQHWLPLSHTLMAMGSFGSTYKNSNNNNNSNYWHLPVGQMNQLSLS